LGSHAMSTFWFLLLLDIFASLFSTERKVSEKQSNGQGPTFVNPTPIL